MYIHIHVCIRCWLERCGTFLVHYRIFSYNVKTHSYNFVYVRLYTLYTLKISRQRYRAAGNSDVFVWAFNIRVYFQPLAATHLFDLKHNSLKTFNTNLSSPRYKKTQRGYSFRYPTNVITCFSHVAAAQRWQI